MLFVKTSYLEIRVRIAYHKSSLIPINFREQTYSLLMKFAISIRTGKVVYAEYKLSRFDRYKCPCCDSKVILRAGYYRDPYFAHASSQTNQAKLNCEDYHPGNGYYVPTPITKKSVSIAESKIELGGHDFFTTLCVEDSESDFRLYLSIPTIPFDRENPISPRDLQKIKIRITAEGSPIAQLPAIELFTGGVKTRYDVKPTEKNYELEVVNNSGSEVDFDFLESPIEGLSPKGNLFGKVDEEWVRIFPNSKIEWGGEYYYVAQSNTSVPHKCLPAEIAVRDGYTRKWKLWRIALPAEPDASVEDWLNKLDYFVVEGRWKLQLLSVPRDYDVFERIYYFNEGEAILFKAMSPFSKSETVLICETEETTEEKQIKTSAENNYFFSVKGDFDKVYLEGFPETEVGTVFINADDAADLLNDKISSLPSINLRLKDDFFESFPEIDDEKTNIIQADGKLESTDIEIILKPEALNDFVKCKVGINFSGASMVFKNRLTFKEAKGEILDIIRKKDTGILTIDAGSLGVITLSLENEIIAELVESRLSSKISGWLSAVAASRLDRAFIGLNSDSRISMVDEKSRRKIIHSRSPFVTAQVRAMAKRKK